MPEDQIKAIAKEYADYYSVSVRTYPHYARLMQEAEDVLTFLSDKYCIVEREKVIKEYNEITDMRNEAVSYGESSRAGCCDSMIGTMELLFGTSMFKQNEE